MLSRRKEEQERELAYGDAVYEVWARGGDCDQVTRDAVTETWYGDGEYDRYATAEIVAHQELQRQRQTRTISSEASAAKFAQFVDGG